MNRRSLTLLPVIGILILSLAGCSSAKAPADSFLFWFGLKRKVKVDKDPVKSAPRYVGAGRCVSCHAANYYVWRLTTRHPDALQPLKEQKQENNKECLPCHTVGYNEKKNNGGYDDKGVVKRLLQGVQCEHCHGAGSNHIKGLSRLKKSYSADACGCHNGPRHPTMDEWKGSEHAKSLQTLRESGNAENRCLKCMSAEAVINGNIIMDKAENPLTCVACHNPHLNEHEKGLRAAKEELCVSCHTMAEGGSRYPQKEIVLGKGIIWGVEVTARSHGTGIGTNCLVCHYYTREYKSDKEPAITGHSFKANVEVCKNCHADGEARWSSTQAEVKGALNRIKASIDSIDSSKLSEDKKLLYDEANHVYNALVTDGSYGIHNRAHIQALIGAAEQRLNTVAGKK